MPANGTERVEKADAVEMVDARLPRSSSVSAPNAGIPPFRRFASRWEDSAFRLDMKTSHTKSKPSNHIRDSETFPF